MTNKPAIWSEEVITILNERKLKIKTDGAKSTQISKNETLIEEALTYANMKGLKKETVDQINHFRLHKKVNLLVELVRATRKSRNDSFDTKDSKSQFEWKFAFTKVEQPGPK